MVTDSILSVIIFKWALINDVSVLRVLQASGWMTSALHSKLPLFFKHTVSEMLRSHIVNYSASSLSLVHTH